MQLNGAAASGTLTNISGAKEFGISSNSSKLFAMLSTSLYSNKQRAVLYEIGANCNDAHVLNGNQDRPWDLYMPTNMDNNIRFRDYGPGLSEDAVYNLLTTYGESTKTDSNEFIGAYGIGSKSPAAVTSTWTVISRFEGVCSEYLVFIDGRGVPSLTKIRSQDTDEESGIEVIIPVSASNSYSWKSEVAEVFKHYKVRPNIQRHTVHFDTPKFVVSGNGWRIKNGGGYYSKAIFVTTQRGYEVDKRTMEEALTPELMNMLNFDMELDFPVGTLETSLSREQLQYTKYTIQNIKDRLQVMRDEFMNWVDAQVASSIDKLDFYKNVAKVGREIFVNSPSKIIPFVKCATFGTITERNLHIYTLSNVNTDGISVFDGTAKISQLKPNFTCFKTHKITEETNHKDNTKNLNLRISDLDTIKIVVDDVKNTKSRVRSWCVGYTTMIVPQSFVIPSELQQFVTKASDLAEPIKRERNKDDVVKKSGLWKIRSNSFIRYTEDEAQDLLENSDKDLVAFHFDSSFSFDSILEAQLPLVRFYKQSRNVVLIGLKTGTEIPDECIEIVEFAKQDFNEKNTVAFIDAHVISQESIKAASNWNDFNCLMKKGVTTDSDSVWNEMSKMWQKLIDEYKNSYKSSAEYEKLTELAELLKQKIVEPSEFMTLASIEEKVYNAYPLVKYLEVNDVPDDLLKSYLLTTGV
jgi:hypothetical protein